MGGTVQKAKENRRVRGHLRVGSDCVLREAWTEVALWGSGAGS